MEKKDIYLWLDETTNKRIIGIRVYDFPKLHIYAYGYRFFDSLRKEKIYLKNNLYKNLIDFKYEYNKNISESISIEREIMMKIISYDLCLIFEMSKDDLYEKFNLSEWMI